MSNQKYEYRQFKVTELLLNPENPRFNPMKHQTEIISAMIEDQQLKLVTLAEHILEYGLNPVDIILIERYGEQWLVREGNRRITALKLLNNPDLVSDNYPKIKKKFYELNKRLYNALIENITCVIMEDKATIDEWVRLKHTGENDGAGTVNWNSQQSSRFNSQTSGNADLYMTFLDELKTLDAIPKEYKDHFVNIRKTNFDRLLSDPDVRKLFNVSNKSGRFSFTGDMPQYFLIALQDLIFNNLSVGKIYTKYDRKKYIDELQERANQESSFKSATYKLDDEICNSTNILGGKSIQGVTVDENSFNSNITPTFTTFPKGHRSYPTERKTLIPQPHTLSISQPRILKIYRELKTLDINTYPNAVASLFRTFIELSVDYYILKHNNIITNTDEDSKLFKKIEAITTYFANNKIAKEPVLRIARQMSSNQSQNHSLKTFHSYVHNMRGTPISADLKTAWDDLWPFTEKIWSTMEL
ncbi:MAG: hypothetical protein FWB84_03405 [Candidatus Bathyarchaeota archaeon]|uniref:hypothetical protein n=1 Tax=Candidatus Bathycorpusculum sp. TaxID=2994959 RepID=UPI0028235603|nr:hypothetical protein [Candidatus Termiticorpusculum sp.]MCL2257465.1 hypothetical protein [Candidatus Termiticorpusculum sp.]MCL2292410.1 hypothetical protein [Candidatus Termiticorpusculum sp.]